VYTEYEKMYDGSSAYHTQAKLPAHMPVATYTKVFKYYNK